MTQVANSKNKRTTYSCSFCGKCQGQVQRLIAGSGDVYICDECIDLSREIIEAEEATVSKNKRTTYRCSFCGKSHDQIQRLVAGPGGVCVCDECIGLYRETIEEA